ncbi:MAG TPA: phosphatase PAP2 family protein [Lacipirellulaceae bacterium]|nr:phosphatase PAP2 family protein [Lacipirellulaceae bacterium]
MTQTASNHTKRTSRGDFRLLLRRSFVAIAACTFAVVFCYYFIDRPVAFFVHNHRIARFEEFRWLTEPPPLVQSWSPLVLIALIIRRAGGPWRRWEHVLFLACVSVIVADQFRQSLGDLCGRYWPETWHDNNPSLIGTGAYGFHPFQVGDDIGSFPSGHATRILAFAAIFWLAIPRWRWFYPVLALPMLIALVAMDYHFVGDVIAGSVLGTIVATWATRLSALEEATSTG